MKARYALPHEGDNGSHTVEDPVQYDDGWYIECDECGWQAGPFTTAAAATQDGAA